jgi:hypothetical protein
MHKLKRDLEKRIKRNLKNKPEKEKRDSHGLPVRGRKDVFQA